MQPRSERFTTTALDSLHLHTLHWGDETSPLVLLLHGGGANAHWWDHIAPTLARQHHVVALDFRGHGDSDYPEELVVGAFNDDLDALFEHLGKDAKVLIGHSMGAGVAVSHAAEGASRDEVRGLIAVDLSRGASTRSRRAARLALTLRRTYATREEAIARYRFLPGSDHASEELRLSIAQHSVAEQPDGRFGFKFDPRWFGVSARPRPDLGAITCPTLFLRGSDSPMLTAEGATELAAQAPQARLVVIEGAGHHVQLDQPGLFLKAVSQFLAEL
jgi:pimeloyl-ACP methyl ester carboxylesterase